MKLALVGYGRMGRAVEEVAVERGHAIVARVVRPGGLEAALATSPPLGGAEVAVEFTRADAAPENILALGRAGIPVVSGTTGWGHRMAEVEAEVRASADRGAALLHAPNFSPGALLFLEVVRSAVRLLDGLEDYDVHLLEIHHRHKADHPGGTARRLAETLVEGLARKRGWREGAADGAADPGLLQVDAVRVGENPGTHVVGVEGPDDRLEFRHEARSRRGFARGAVMAAEWIRGRTGVLSVEEWLRDWRS